MLRPKTEITLFQQDDRLHLTFPWDQQIKAAINLLPQSDRQWQNPYYVVFPNDCLEIARQIGREATLRHQNWVFLDRTALDPTAIADQKRLHQARDAHIKSREFLAFLENCENGTFRLAEWGKSTLKLQFQKMLSEEAFTQLKTYSLEIGKQPIDDRDNPKLKRGWWFCIPRSPEILSALIAKKTVDLKHEEIASICEQEQPTTYPLVCHFQNRYQKLWVGLLIEQIPLSWLNQTSSISAWQLAEDEDDWYWVTDAESLILAVCDSGRVQSPLAKRLSATALSKIIRDLGLEHWTARFLEQLNRASVTPIVNPDLYSQAILKQQIKQKIYDLEGYAHPLDRFLIFYQAQLRDEQQAITKLLGWDNSTIEQWHRQILAQKQAAARQQRQESRCSAQQDAKPILDNFKKLELIELAAQLNIAIKKSWKLEQIRTVLEQPSCYQAVCERVLGIPAEEKIKSCSTLEEG